VFALRASRRVIENEGTPMGKDLSDKATLEDVEGARPIGVLQQS
jgi:hypothetical protein